MPRELKRADEVQVGDYIYDPYEPDKFGRWKPVTKVVPVAAGNVSLHYKGSLQVHKTSAKVYVLV